MENEADLGDLGGTRNVVDEEEPEINSTSEDTPDPKVKVETGAPRPPAQTPGVEAAKAAPAGPPPPPTIKVGGGFILAYFHPYNMEDQARLQGRPTPKPNFETFRAAILLDSKIDRFGVHIEFRARDTRVREFFESTAWLEEIYGSVDLLTPGSEWGSSVLKVGKSYSQFGLFWDSSFYGNVHLRDGLKLDANYGLSLEGKIGKQLGLSYFAQYFILDGGTNTSLNGRDTISVPAPASGYPPRAPSGGTSVSLGRRRNMFVGRLEPYFALSPTTVFKLGASIQNFTADFGPTMDQENVIRYGADVTANVAWFGAWAEYTQQKGRHVLGHPFAARPAAGMLPPAPGVSSDDVQYLLVGGRFFYKGIMLRYNFNSATYRGLRLGPGPEIEVRETMHVPGIMLTATQQLFLMIEAPLHRRHLPAIGEGAARDLVLDRSIVVTLHARI